ncbi:MAG: Trm112 family protein [Candidatus Zixiibacteriota bacterium]
MALSDNFLDKLVCPSCKSKLAYDAQNNKLVCHQCSLAYRVVNDVPVMLIDEAEKLQK